MQNRQKNRISSCTSSVLKMSVVLLPLLLLVTAVLLLSRQINAEYRQFDGIIQAAASYIHYSEGFVIAPGTLDISDLVFSTIDSGPPTTKNDVNQSSQSSSSSSSSGTAGSGDSVGTPKEYTDDEEWNDDDTGGLKVGEDDDNRQLIRQLAVNNGGGGVSFIDIVIFHEVWKMDSFVGDLCFGVSVLSSLTLSLSLSIVSLNNTNKISHHHVPTPT